MSPDSEVRCLCSPPGSACLPPRPTPAHGLPPPGLPALVRVRYDPPAPGRPLPTGRPPGCRDAEPGSRGAGRPRSRLLPHPGGLKLPATSPAGQAPAHRPPLVEVLTTPGCPHRDAAIALVQQVCVELACNAEVRLIDICDQQAAKQTRFLGS